MVNQLPLWRVRISFRQRGHAILDRAARISGSCSGVCARARVRAPLRKARNARSSRHGEEGTGEERALINSGFSWKGVAIGEYHSHPLYEI